MMKTKILPNCMVWVLIGILLPAAGAQAARQGKSVSGSGYRDLIEKNLALRKQLKALKEKYAGLEGERKILISHIRELQKKKEARSKKVQNLKNMIASLRIEMLKDPKLTRVIRSLNQRIEKTENERDFSNQKMKALASEEKKLIKEMDALKGSLKKERRANIQKRKSNENKLGQVQAENQQLAKALDETRADLGRQERLADALEAVKKENARLGEKNRDLDEELKKTKGFLETAETALKTKAEKRRGEKASIEEEKSKLTKELKRTNGLLKTAEKNLKIQVSRISREKDRLKKSLGKAEKENLKLDEKIVQLQDQARQRENINRQLMADLKKEQTALARVHKDLKKEMLKSAFEKEHYEEQVKFAKADKAMLEAKVRDYQERALIAETKLGKEKGALKEKNSKIFLKESEVAVLREEKSKLEEKLVRYIERLMERQEGKPRAAKRKGGAREDPNERWQGLQEGGVKSKEDIARQKLNMHYNLALAYDKQKRYKEEEREYRKCLKINPKDANVHYNLAILYDDKLNKNKKAVEHYKKYLDLHPIGQATSKVKAWMLHAEQESRLGDQAK